MKKFVLLCALVCSISALAQVSDPNLVAAQAELDSLTQQVQTLTNANSSSQQTIASLQSQIAALNVTIASDQMALANQQSQIQSLQSQLAAVQTSGALPANLLKQFTNLQSQSGWVLASGAAGNTGATGSTGSCTLTPNSDGTATFVITPAGPYYDCFEYRPLAGTWYSRTLPPAPSPVLGYFLYNVEYNGDATNLPLAQALEIEARWYDGTYMYQMAGQIKMATKTFRYYDPCATTGTSGCVGGWIDTKVPVNIQAGQWEQVQVLYKAGAGVTTLLGVFVDGSYHPLNIAIKASAKTVTPWMHTSIQLDSNKAGTPYQVLVRNISVGWL